MKRFSMLLGLALLATFVLAASSPGVASEQNAKRAALSRLERNFPAVQTYEQGQRITRLYGQPFGFGSNPEEIAERFRHNYSGIFGVEPQDLQPQSLLSDGRHTQPVMYLPQLGDYKFTLVCYSQYKESIPVFRADLRLLMLNQPGSPLVWAGSALRDLGDFSPGDVRVNRALAIGAARSFSSGLVKFTEPRLVIWAGVNDMEVSPRVAMEIIADNGMEATAEHQKWLLLVDARSGEILYTEDLIVHLDVEGNVSGRATNGRGADICHPEDPLPMPWARVYIEGGDTAYADPEGDFVIPNPGSQPDTVISHLVGRWFRADNQAGSNAELSMVVTPPGPADFLHNEDNTDEFYRAQVNGYLQANVVRDFTLTYNPDYPGLQQAEFPVNVNINDNCNAYYNYSSINFFRAGGGCANTAFSTVIHHEYGHHLVAMAGSGQGQYGEGQADVMGVMITDDPGLAYGFYGDCNTPLRNANNYIQYPCSGEIHYCGQLLSGCVWHTRNELAIANPTNYMDILANMSVNAILMHTGDMITPQITIDYLTLDDDNGNIYDGTPHWDEICTGFGLHNMDCPELMKLAFSYPNGLPEMVHPSGGTRVRVEVSGVMEEPVPGTGKLHCDLGAGWVEIPMEVIAENVYDAVFPESECGTEVLYYFSAQTDQGNTATDPMGAPQSSYSAISATGLVVTFEDDFETHQGWTVSNDPSLTDGAWERGVPAGGGDRGDPPTDYDGSGQCYVTDNEDGNSDVDGGPTMLISPTFDAGGGEEAYIYYARWFTNDDRDIDRLDVHVSNDDGEGWVLVESVPDTQGWVYRRFKVSDFVTPTSQMKMRFSATDNPNNSVTEAGVDAFKVVAVECEELPLVAVEIIPDNPPIVVPPGGQFTYTGILSNNTSDPQTVDAWVMVTLPNGDPYGPVKMLDNKRLSPNQVITRTGIRQMVHPLAPPGDYLYTAYCGEYPTTILSQSSFGFTVTSGVAGGADGWTLKGWFDEEELLPQRTELFGNLPNPFNASTTFNYALERDAHVSLEVYDLMGRKVTTVVDEAQTAGYKSVRWDASACASGVYFYKLTVGDFSQTMRMTLVK
jgi:hypothetical protein